MISGKDGDYWARKSRCKPSGTWRPAYISALIWAPHLTCNNNKTEFCSWDVQVSWDASYMRCHELLKFLHVFCFVPQISKQTFSHPVLRRQNLSAIQPYFRYTVSHKHVYCVSCVSDTSLAAPHGLATPAQSEHKHLCWNPRSQFVQKKLCRTRQNRTVIYSHLFVLSIVSGDTLVKKKKHPLDSTVERYLDNLQD